MAAPHGRAAEKSQKNRTLSKSRGPKVDDSVFQSFTNVPIAPNTAAMESWKKVFWKLETTPERRTSTKTVSDRPMAVKKTPEVKIGEIILTI